MTDALVLCGGRGSRIAHLLPPHTPKFLTPLWDGRPVGEHVLSWLAVQECERAVLCVGHGAARIVSTVGIRRDLGIEICWSLDPSPDAGTAFALRHALPLARGDWIVICNGDTLIDGGFPGEPIVTSNSALRDFDGRFSGAARMDRAAIDAYARPEDCEWTALCSSFLDVGTPEGLARAQEKAWP